MTERAKAMDEAELRVTGIEALNKALGPAQALRFLALFYRGQMDYVEISKEALRRVERRGCLQEGQGTSDWLRVWPLHFFKIAPKIYFHPRLLLYPGPERACLVAKLQQLYGVGTLQEIFSRVESCLLKDAAKYPSPPGVEGRPLHTPRVTPARGAPQ